MLTTPPGDPATADQIPGIHGEHCTFTGQIPDIIYATEHIAQHRGNGCTGSAHVQRQNEDGVQHNVHHRTDHAAQHGGVGRTLAPHHMAEGIGQQNKGCAHRNIKQVIPGKFPGVRRAAQNAQKWFHAQQDGCRSQQPHSQRTVKAEG